MNLCPACGQLMNCYEQPALLPGRPARELAECVNKSCVRYAITLSPAEHAALTDEDVERYSYARMPGTMRAETRETFARAEAEGWRR